MGQSKRLLLIEDDPHIQEVIRVTTTSEGYDLTICQDGAEGLEKAILLRPDLVILDLMLPKLSGFEVCKSLRANGLMVPIIMLTAKDEEDDEILGLQLGADDYITKPFSTRQLAARIKALFRRSHGHPNPFEIDQERREVLIYGQALDLSPKEYELLVFFAKQPGRVLSREDLLGRIWGSDYAGTTRTVDEHVKRIRQKLAERAGGREFIRTVWGVGYLYEENA